MSHLVTDFLINPVLRQAGRFSRYSASEDHAVLLTNQDIPYDSNSALNEAIISDVNEPISIDSSLGDGRMSSPGTVSGRPVVSSPVEEVGGLAGDVDSRQDIRPHEATGAIDPPSAIPRRLASFPPGRIGVDDDAMSDNPYFGVPSRFETASPMSASFSSSNHNLTLNSTEDSGTPPSIAPQPPGLVGVPRKRDSSLPEDDGMSALRKRIISIQSMSVSAADKALLMHQLLTEGYSHSQINQNAKPLPKSYSPASLVSQERPSTPGSLSSFSFWQTTANDTPPESSPTNSFHTFHLSPDDLRPTYIPFDDHAATTSDSGDSDEAEKSPSLGCRHYKRNVKLQCFTCSRWYTCRFCHDEVEDHVLNRKETRNMLCMLCGCAQRAGDLCVDCGARSAWYYCGICHLWDDDTNKSIYHCNDCGICRVGRGIGKDFFHCKTCDVCIKISNEFSHKCIERASDCDCPICGEYLFSSPESVCFMRCGHSIHRKCYYALMKTSYKCPICSQSIVNMETQFRNLDRSIDSQPMPPQFQDTKAMVSCNDCYAKSLVKYHWLGLKCAICDSYNTAQLQILTLSDNDSDISTAAIPQEEAVLDIPSGNSLIPDPHGHPSLSGGNRRTRRHSSHVLPIAIPNGTSSLHISPYQVPERFVRSVSPLRGIGFLDEPIVTNGADGDMESDEEEEDLDFWGGDAPRSPTSPRGAENEEYEDDSGDDSMSVDDDDDDEGDEEDHMQLFGHR